ncbi:hypothetical protein ACI09J_001781 [Cronobacter turicensis]
MFSSIKEALSSAVTTASQRVRNPVFGAFVLSWCAFNWKQILYLFFSDKGIYNKIEYISANSNWSFNLLLPVASTLVICVVMPWANNFISWLQAKPLDNNDSIENQRKAKQILRSTRLRRLEAKRDVTYEKVKTGAEKDIQSMKEQILSSQDRMGELTRERDSFREISEQQANKIQSLENEILKMNDIISSLEEGEIDMEKAFKEYEEIMRQEEIIFNNNLKKNHKNILPISVPLKKDASLDDFTNHLTGTMYHDKNDKT